MVAEADPSVDIAPTCAPTHESLDSGAPPSAAVPSRTAARVLGCRTAGQRERTAATVGTRACDLPGVGARRRLLRCGAVSSWRLRPTGALRSLPRASVHARM